MSHNRSATIPAHNRFTNRVPVVPHFVIGKKQLLLNIVNFVKYESFRSEIQNAEHIISEGKDAALDPQRRSGRNNFCEIN